MRYLLVLVSSAVLFGTKAQDKIFVSTDLGGLFQVEPSTCYARLIGYSPAVFLDIAFTPNGRLWGILNGSLYEIDTTDASIAVVGSTANFNTPGLVAFDNDVLLGEEFGSLYGIRTSDGVAWPIVPIGFQVSGDLTWFQGSLYITAISPYRLVRMQVAPDLSGVSDIEVMGLLGGGIGQWYGANTTFVAPCASEPYIMLAWDGIDMYKVSPYDASVQPLCLGILPYGSHGGASIAESRDIDLPELGMPNVFTPNGDGKNDLYAPMDQEYPWAMKVYDRWGQLVFDSKGRKAGWSGRNSAGEQCSDGVYYYRVIMFDECNGSNVRTGHLSLLR
ncbi:MAG: gliding motility-associated C-terminal domain-containing protein [Flavobacteriales bacterium]|nr:gliding motility-associated C-terminal domain-containing protein [Flavobacteriales bacterium]MBK6945085.1 gliding motility-associated C-terminal domain-containing protein [Flavobacteriales bacterium]MBK7239433.1 gliding motility-associated C-terminal domain-containing protein [Flavobacteriales bacterium]HQV51466.1 gliding motility-associated C-terminal domain-containing protein [Flavobacteriales bacterium]